MMMIPGKRAPAGTIRGKLSPTGMGGEGHRILRDQDDHDCYMDGDKDDRDCYMDGDKDDRHGEGDDCYMDGNDSVTVREWFMMMRTMLMISILL